MPFVTAENTVADTLYLENIVSGCRALCGNNLRGNSTEECKVNACRRRGFCNRHSVFGILRLFLSTFGQYVARCVDGYEYLTDDTYGTRVVFSKVDCRNALDLFNEEILFKCLVCFGERRVEIVLQLFLLGTKIDLATAENYNRAERILKCVSVSLGGFGSVCYRINAINVVDVLAVCRLREQRCRRSADRGRFG